MTVELEEQVLNEIYEHPEKSTRELSVQFNVNQSIIWRILKEQQLHPYHLQKLHTCILYCDKTEFPVLVFANGF